MIEDKWTYLRLVFYITHKIIRRLMQENAKAFSCKVGKVPQWYMAQEGDATMFTIAS